jgi:hypothetical protein
VTRRRLEAGRAGTLSPQYKAAIPCALSLGAPGDPHDPFDQILYGRQVTHLRAISARVLASQEDKAQDARAAVEADPEGHDSGWPPAYLWACVHHAEMLAKQARQLLEALAS